MSLRLVFRFVSVQVPVSSVRMIEPVMEENYLPVLPDKLQPGRLADDAPVAHNWLLPSTSAPQTGFRGR